MTRYEVNMFRNEMYEIKNAGKGLVYQLLHPTKDGLKAFAAVIFGFFVLGFVWGFLN